MPHEYTRQRQGRDFSFVNHLRNAEMSVEGNYNNIDGIIGNAPPKDDTEEKKSMLDRLDYYKAEVERNAREDVCHRHTAPVDGGEPPQDTPAAERGR